MRSTSITRTLVIAPVLALTAVFLSSSSASAHVRWFVSDGEHAGGRYSADFVFLSVLVSALAFIFLAGLLQRPALHIHAITRNEHWITSAAERVFVFAIGATFVIGALKGEIIAPNLSVHDGVASYIAFALQMAVGVMLLTRVSYVLPGLLITWALLPLALVTNPASLFLDYVIEFQAIAVALVLLGRGKRPTDNYLLELLRIREKVSRPAAVAVLRVGLGATLVVLAIHNKLQDPGLVLAFLEEHELNFMALLGFDWFTNTHFALATGIAEMTLGGMLAFAVATRFVTVILTGFVLTTMSVLGPAELVGHFPLIGIALMLIVNGSGSLRPAEETEPAYPLQPDLSV